MVVERGFQNVAVVFLPVALDAGIGLKLFDLAPCPEFADAVPRFTGVER